MVANVTEFNQNNIRGHFGPGEWRMWQRAGDELADMAALWGGVDKVLLVPTGTDRAWLADLAAQMRWRIDVVEPKPATGRLLEDALLDRDCVARLVELLPGPCTLEAWGTTPALAPLVATLHAAGVDLDARVPAPGDQWSIGYLDGKLALDDLARWVPDLKVPRSYTATDFSQLLGLARAMIAQGRPFVAKSNVGVGGFGSYAVIDPTPDAVDRLIAAIDNEPVFREGPYLVQEWLQSSSATLKPTYDGVVGGPDGVETVGVGGMLVDGCTYRGVAVGDIPLPDSTLKRVVQIGEAVGRASADLGFVGWYDVDFVLTDSGDLYATEINARRTSPTHAFALHERWHQHDPAIRCVVCDDHIPVDNAGDASWEAVRSQLVAVQGEDVRCVATIVRTLASEEPALGVALGARDFEAALAARARLIDRLDGTATRNPPPEVAVPLS